MDGWLHQQPQFAQNFVERQLRKERQGVLDRQPLLKCQRLKFGLIARAQHCPALNRPLIPAGDFGRSIPVLSVVACFVAYAIGYCRLEPWPIRRVTGSEDLPSLA